MSEVMLPEVTHTIRAVIRLTQAEQYRAALALDIEEVNRLGEVLVEAVGLLDYYRGLDN